jgi:hypothetical protein
VEELRLIDVADYLGVTKQRVSQLGSEKGFPRPRHRADGTALLASGRDRALGGAQLVGLQAVAQVILGLACMKTYYRLAEAELLLEPRASMDSRLWLRLLDARRLQSCSTGQFKFAPAVVGSLSP